MQALQKINLIFFIVSRKVRNCFLFAEKENDEWDALCGVARNFNRIEKI